MTDMRKPFPRLKEMNIPYYVQIYDIIYDMIEDGTYKEGDHLPGENILAACWDVSRSTVRMAIRKLEEDGYIYKMQGHKTTVTGKAARSKISLNQIANPCMTSCITPITSVKSQIEFQSGGKLISDMLGIEQRTFNALKINLHYYADDCHVATSMMVLPLMTLEQYHVGIDDEEALKQLALTTVYEHAKYSKISLSVVEQEEVEADPDKPQCDILLVMDEVLKSGSQALSYQKYWMDINWYRMSLERRK